jgi:hypothetical protein
MRSLLRGMAGAALVLGLAALLTGPDGLSAQDKKKDPKGKDPKSAVPAPPVKKDEARTDDKDRATVGISTSDGLSLNAYWYQGTAADKNPPDAVLMFPAPGNKVNDAWMGLAKALSAKNFSVLLFDWRGCGMNAADTAGQRILAEKELFWREPYNNILLKQSRASIEDKGLDYKSIHLRAQGNIRYRDFFLNDLLAARFYLDRQNDNKKCNSSRIWIVTEKEGGHMGLAFVASEFPRNSIYDPKFQVLAGTQFKSAGKDFVGMTVLSYSSGSSSISGIFNTALKILPAEPARDARDHLERRMAMIMVHGKKEGPGASRSALSLVGAGGDAEALKKNYKYLREIDNSKAGATLSGIGLIDPMDSFGVKKDIVEAMVGVSKALPGNKDPYDREANKMTIIPRFKVEAYSKR